MAVTQDTYTGNGSQVLYPFSFPYLATTDIKVKLDGVDTTAYTLANATTVQMNSAPASDAKIIIYRNTDNDNKKATFYPGSAIKAEDLNNNYDQILYTVQEVDNNSMSTLGDTAMQGDMLIGQGFGLQFEGTTPDDFETRLIAEDPTADRVITMPDATGTMVLTSNPDNTKLKFGTDDDGLEIYHDGSNSYISDVGTGNLNITASRVNINNHDNTENIGRFDPTEGCKFYYTNSLKFQTLSDGASITGNLGINTTDPGNLLDIKGTGHSKVLIETTGTGNAAGIQIKHASGNAAEQTWQIQTDGSADGNLKLRNATGDTDVVFVKPDGKVGINTTSPETLLDVYGDGANGELTVQRSDGASILTQAQSGQGQFGTNSNHNLQLMANSTGYVTLKTDGKVGIGESDPDAKLVVYRETVNAANPIVEVRSDHDTTDSIKFSVDGDGEAYFSDRVGIGTTTPDTLLHLAGEDTAVIRLENTDTSLTADQIIGGLEFEKQDPSGAGVGVAGGLRMYSGTDGITSYLSLSTADATTNNVERVRITSDGALIIDTGNAEQQLREFTSTTDSDISGLFTSGSNFGTLHEVSPNGNHVLALRENDTTDSFAIISGGGNYSDDSVYDTVVAKFRPISCELYYDNVKRLETTSGGISFNDGNITNVGSIALGTGNDLEIKHDGTNATIDNDTGILYIKSNTQTILHVNDTENAITATANGPVNLYHDNVLKIETSSHGAAITGGLTTNGAYDFFTSSNAGGYSNLTLKKSDSGGDGDDFLQCRSSGSSSDSPPGNLAKLLIAGTGDVTNANNSYGSISDSKLKENIVDANSQWNDLKAIKVRNFNFKTDSSTKLLGVVAQEVETISPALVAESIDRDSETNEDLGTKTKSVKYSVLYMKAVKALQEAMTRIETLEAKVAALESA